jgi:hypothetical protein
LAAYQESYDLYDQYFDDKLADLTELIKVVCSLTGVLFVLLYIVYYLPLIQKMQNMVLDTKKMIKLIPQEMLAYGVTDETDQRKASTTFSLATN